MDQAPASSPKVSASTPRITVLGGYGHTGRLISELLCRFTEAQIVVAGRSLEKAQALARQLAGRSSEGRVTGVALDAADPKSLPAGLSGTDLLLDCGTTNAYVETTARAALDCGCDVLDIHYPEEIAHALENLAPEITAAGRCFITQAGIHPGLPGNLVRLAASELPGCQKVAIGLLLHQRNAASVDSAAELMADLDTFPLEFFRAGEWRKTTYKDAVEVDFGTGFGKRAIVPMGSYELRGLPEKLGLTELTFGAAGFNWFVDWIVFPLAMMLFKIKRNLGLRAVSRLFLWGMNSFTQPPFGTVTTVDAEKPDDGGFGRFRAVVFHEDGYYITAAAVVACVKQYLDGTIRRPGLYLMGQTTDPLRLLADMGAMGVSITRSAT